MYVYCLTAFRSILYSVRSVYYVCGRLLDNYNVHVHANEMSVQSCIYTKPGTIMSQFLVIKFLLA